MNLPSDSQLFQFFHTSSDQTHPTNYYYPQRNNCISCSCFKATTEVSPFPTYQPLSWPSSYYFPTSSNLSTLSPSKSKLESPKLDATFQYQIPVTSSDISKVSATPELNCSEAAPSSISSRPSTTYPFLTPISGNYSSTEAYEGFRRKILAQLKMVPAKRRGKACEDVKIDSKRRKNNEAARRSREARKAMKDEIVIRCAFLEQENAQIRAKLADLKMEAKMLERKLFTRS